MKNFKRLINLYLLQLAETLTDFKLTFLFAEELIYSIQSGSKTAGTKGAIPDKTVERLYGA